MTQSIETVEREHKKHVDNTRVSRAVLGRVYDSLDQSLARDSNLKPLGYLRESLLSFSEKGYLSKGLRRKRLPDEQLSSMLNTFTSVAIESGNALGVDTALTRFNKSLVEKNQLKEAYFVSKLQECIRKDMAQTN